MRVAVITLDPRVYYMATKILKRHGIGFYSLLPGEEIPPEVEVVVTDSKTEVNFPKKIRIEDEDFVVEVLSLLSGKRRYERIFIGVDPGKRPGLCVVGDGTVIEVHRLKSPTNVEPILELLERYPNAVLKIGNGGGSLRLILLKELGRKLGMDLEVEMVNERETTPRLGNVEGNVRDIIAAVNIALRQGKRIRIKDALPRREPTKRELDDIKRRSRELSGNVTISTKLARRVAFGEITIEEAISIQRGGQDDFRKGGGRRSKTPSCGGPKEGRW